MGKSHKTPPEKTEDIIGYDAHTARMLPFPCRTRIRHGFTSDTRGFVSGCVHLQFVLGAAPRRLRRHVKKKEPFFLF